MRIRNGSIMSKERLPTFALALAVALGLPLILWFVTKSPGGDTFLPHANCYLNNPKLVALHGWYWLAYLMLLMLIFALE